MKQGTVDMESLGDGRDDLVTNKDSVDAESVTVQENPIGFSSTLAETSLSGVKRPRISSPEHNPSVRVNYDSLTRESKRKLHELLQKWSEWHALHCSSTPDHNELESGEDTFYPALNAGLNKSSAVSFWMDNQTRNQHDKELVFTECDSAPHYDRAYALGLTSLDGSNNQEGGLDLMDVSRCFNCGSYNHSLKECLKPRNNAAVNKARKQQKSKRNLNAGSRNPTRYYQSSSGGKYDDLKPGSLDSETKKLLGLGELDPPPWLNRMREIGYPPGYLELDDEDQPSGITIFGEEEEENKKIEQEDGEIFDKDYPKLEKKKKVEFPGINAPIPETADERRWAAGASSSEQHWNRSIHRANHSSDIHSREHNREQRWSHDFSRDDGPPGVPPFSSYSNYESYSYKSSRTDFQIPRTPSFGRSTSERDRRNPLEREDSTGRGSHSSYLSSNRRVSSHNHEVSEEWVRYEPNPGHSSYSREKHNSHHYHDRR